MSGELEFDIAELVRGAMSQRKTKKVDKASLIDKLIDEALLEFTSLQDKDKQNQVLEKHTGPAHGKGGFEDIGAWADELDLAHKPSVDTVTPAIEAGNLAALEEDEPIMSSRSPRDSVADDDEPSGVTDKASGAEGGRVSLPGKPASGGGALVPPAEQGSSGAVKLVILVAVLAIAAAGAWFGGLIPH
jgi:hypothetical protein